jgi:tetratricopeptide (TPR) repeat protein
MIPWIVIGVCGVLAFVLACLIPVVAPGEGGMSGWTGKVIGEGRSAVSASLYEQADLYFHKGVGVATKRAITNDWFQRSLDEISPHAHRHTEGVDSAEILPWLRMATSADPHNVEAFLVMSFWLVTGVNRPDLAAQVLAEAQRQNPRDYRVPQEQGRMAIHEGRLPDARRKVEMALSRWPSGLPEDRQALLDKAELFVLLGFLLEETGGREQAVENFKNALAIFPERAYIKERVTVLESGGTPDPGARQSLELLVRRTAEDLCASECGGHGDHAHEEHEGMTDRRERVP